MTWGETFRTALEAIRSRRMRSSLTMLGILIGIAAVMLTVGLGQGAQAQVRSQINQLGSNLLIVSPGSTTTSSGIRGGRGSASTLTMRDATALASRVVAPDIAKVAPVVTGSQSLAAGTTNWTTNVVGTTPDWLQVRARSLAEGRFFSLAELLSSAKLKKRPSARLRALTWSQSGVVPTTLVVQLVVPAVSDCDPVTTGATLAMSGATTRLASAVESRIVSVEADPRPPRMPVALVVLPGETISRLLPSWLIWSRTLACAPCPSPRDGLLSRMPSSA